MSAVMKSPRFADGPAYLAWEALQTERHEYFEGEVYAMVGARTNHNTISFNIHRFLWQALRGSSCRVYGMDLKLQISAEGNYLYPDVMATCDPRDRQPGEDRFIAHPWLVVEVLSDSTALFDRGRKFESYRSIDTLTHYLLVEQDRPHAELFFKNPQGQWVLQPLGATDAMQIEMLGRPWPVAALFEDIDFTPAPASATVPAPPAA